MPIHRRLPKRGFTNINRVHYTELNLDNIQKLIDTKKIDPKKIISYKTLMDLGLVKSKKAKIKLLGKGDIKGKIDIEVSAFSRSAKENIEKIKKMLNSTKKLSYKSNTLNIKNINIYVYKKEKDFEDKFLKNEMKEINNQKNKKKGLFGLFF